MTTTRTEAEPETTLHKGRLGVIGIVFFVVAAAAPLVGMTGAVPVAIVLGNGAAAPGAYLIVGITKLESPTSPSGQRAVTVFTFVQNFRPSMPCWLVSPKAERFQPPKVW